MSAVRRAMPGRRRGASSRGALVVCCLSLVVAACSSRPTIEELEAATEVRRSAQRFAKEVVLSPGDQIEVAVYRNGEVSRTVTVQSDGVISLPLLDQVQVGGLTLAEVDDKITALFSERLRDPEVTVILTNAVEPMVYVMGDVGLVKPVPLRMGRTVSQAIAHSGGIPRNGAPKSVALVRLEDDGFFTVTYVAEDARTKIDAYVAFQNSVLRPDDLIVVPESTRSKAGRFINDFITTPLTAFNQIVNPYFQFKLIQLFEDN
jgi:polysaccharide export outer membrane protein